MAETNDRTLTHIVGTFLIQAEGAFLNGAGLGQGENRNVTIPKTLRDFKDTVPYVSSQAWKRWLRNTFQDEYPNEPAAVIKAEKFNVKGNPEKIGTEMNPIVFAEDDIFGYMRAAPGQGRVAEESADALGLGSDMENDGEATGEVSNPTSTPAKSGMARGERVKSIMRPSPFSASILMSLRKDGWQGLDEGYVHLKEGTPLPYSTRFYNTQLQGVFGLNYARLGVFRNEGDRVEIDPELVQKHSEKLDKDTERNIYTLKDNQRKKRAEMILKSLAVLRKPAKDAQFATDIAPKVLIVAGLTSGNLIFNDLFKDTKEGPELKIDTLKEIISDYADRLVTPVYIGVRKGYLNPENEAQLHKIFPTKPKDDDVAEHEAWGKTFSASVHSVEVVTPLEAIKILTQGLPQ